MATPKPRPRERIAGIYRAGARGMSVRSATVRSLPEPDDQGRFRWVLASEQPVVIYDWERGEFVHEILVLDGLHHADQIPLLDSHNRFSAANQIGSVRDFSLDAAGGLLLGMVQFSEADELSRTTKQKVAEGHITDGSVGYQVEQSIWVPDGSAVNVDGRDYTGPVRVTTRARLLEFSITPIGADDMAKVRAFCAAPSTTTKGA